jgi:hypothetical protein
MMIEVGFSNPSFSFGQFGRKELYLGQAFRRRRDMARPLLGQVSAQKIRNRSGGNQGNFRMTIRPSISRHSLVRALPAPYGSDFVRETSVRMLAGSLCHSDCLPGSEPPGV